MSEPSNDVLVEQGDVEASLLRPLTSVESQYINTLCAQASAKLRTLRRNIDARIAAFEADPNTPGAVDPQVVSAMLGDVIARRFINPNRAASDSRTTGPFSRTTSWASSGKPIGNTGDFIITPEDLAQLETAPTRTPRSIKMRPALAPHRFDRYYCR